MLRQSLQPLLRPLLRRIDEQANGGLVPSMSLNFLSDASLDTRVTFTRASGATRINPAGLIETVASNAPRFDYDPMTLQPKGLLIEEQRTNELLNSDTLATQSVTVTAAQRTLSFYGAGTVTLSGAYSGTLVGSGVYPARSTLTFTPTAGILTLTVTGSVRFSQMELGAFPTSYIPTTTATATRAADVAVMAGANFSSWYRQDEGTLFAEAVGINDISGATRRFAEVTSGSSSDRYLIGFNATNSSRFIVSAGNVIQTDITVSASAGTITKIAAAYKFNSFQQATNGVTGVEDTFGSVPTVNQIIFGGDGSLIGGNTTLNGHIRRIAYFPRRLRNAELQRVTA